jgi:hypothetical protein
MRKNKWKKPYVILLTKISNNSIHLVTNSSATDAMTINGVGAVAFNGSYGTAGGVLTTNGLSW